MHKYKASDDLKVVLDTPEVRAHPSKFDPIFKEAAKTVLDKAARLPVGYNDDLTDGMQWSGKKINPNFQRCPAAEHVIANQGIKITYARHNPHSPPEINDVFRAMAQGVDLIDVPISGDAAYNPPTDEIYLPTREQFASTAEFYSAAFHELSHATGHKSRLNRRQINMDGNCNCERCKLARGIEEMTAELSSVMICAVFGLDATKHASEYIANWSSVKGFKKEHLAKALRDAREAANYILRDY